MTTDIFFTNEPNPGAVKLDISIHDLDEDGFVVLHVNTPEHKHSVFIPMTAWNLRRELVQSKRYASAHFTVPTVPQPPLSEE